MLVRVCLGFFTRMYYVDSCEIRSDFTCKVRSEIDVFDVKCEIDDIPYQEKFDASMQDTCHI